MSRFCGKCDVADCFSGYSDDQIAETKFYINGHRLDINNRFDLIPYYPYIIAISTNKIVHLSSQSYVDVVESERLGYILADIKRLYRKCKREKREFNTEENRNGILSWSCQKRDEAPDYVIELFKRVEEEKEKADTWGIHINEGMIPMYRAALVEEMVNNGYKKDDAENWVYRHLRFFE